ncbi:MAG: MFS transporter [Alcanivoracaceae bacterium]
MTALRPDLIRTELRLTGTLAGVFALRMFGLFMLLPVFAVYGSGLSGANPLLIGTAIGIYGLMQALLQIPFGALSDRIGRRPVIIGGLVLFVLGGAVAAQAETIYGVILGRAVQGAGAIASVIMAMVSDVVSEQHRTRAMAALGMSIGASFMLALILGPLLAEWLGLAGLFWLSAVLGLAALLLVLAWVPAVRVANRRAALGRRERFRRIFASADMMRLNVGILTLHLVLTALFVVVPVRLGDELGLPLAQHSLLYLGVLIGSFVLMVPLIIAAERRGVRRVKLIAIGLVALAMVGLLAAGPVLWQFALVLLVFFVGFNVLEALLPSLAGRLAPAATRGTAMGVYSTFQFLGVFLGAQLAGLMLQWTGMAAVVWCCLLLLVGWWWVVWQMREPVRFETRMLALPEEGGRRPDWQSRLLAVKGVIEVVVVPEEYMALVKIDPASLDQGALEHCIGYDAGLTQT